VPPLLSFLSSSPSPYHAVASCAALLDAAGFRELPEHAPFPPLLPAGLYYFTRDRTSLFAFAVGGAAVPSAPPSLRIAAAHSDSPNLRVKPASKLAHELAGVEQLAVEPYGGGLWHTWFDRDLSVAGLAYVRDAETGEVTGRLVDVREPVCSIPSLAIHLQTAEERKAFEYNKETHLVPVLGTDVAKTAEGDLHSPKLLELLAASLGVPAESISDLDLGLYDVCPPRATGASGSLLASARLDNLFSCYTSVAGLINHVKSDAFGKDEGVACVALFDHEEVGSVSTVGAGGTLIKDAIARVSRGVCRASPPPDLAELTALRSFVLSLDMAHAVHPNYADKHNKEHAPKLNGGMVLKTNRNQRYASSAQSSFIMRDICRRAGLGRMQEFAVRNDCGCGSTIGPAISANTGVRAVDVGAPMLAMHSVREVMGAEDVDRGVALCEAFFRYFGESDASLR
jgi:aspartyl aminopeptidase